VPRFVCQLAVSVERTSVREAIAAAAFCAQDCWLAETTLGAGRRGADRFSML
jgi:hypothetical protein